MGSNSETKKTNLDNDDIDDTELNSGNGVPNNEEEKEDSGCHKKITELTEEEIRSMEFESVDKAIDFYQMYGKCCGFGVRKDDKGEDVNEKVKDPKFLNGFNSLIYANYTPERFETEWKMLIENHGVSDNEWVNKVYAKKTKWASAYMREIFFCGIRTTSLCEGINSFIKRYMDNKSSLVDFLHNFERALKEYRHNELVSDFKSFYSEPVLTSALQGYENEASKIFTRKKFGEVKSEIDDVAALNVIERSVLGSNVMLKINRFKNPDYVVLVCIDKVHSNFLCDCRQFQRIGIPCSHIICAMKYEHIDRFPNSLICKRWTKSAKADFISTITSEESDTEKLFMLRRGAMSAAFNKLCDVSCKRATDYKEAMEGIHDLCEKISKRQDGGAKEKGDSSVIGDPIMVKTKGAPRKNKFKKQRRCSRCKQTGHNKRKCPTPVARDNLHEVSDEDSTCHSDDDSRNKSASDSDDEDDHVDSVSVSNGIHENYMSHDFVYGNASARCTKSFTSWNRVPNYSFMAALEEVERCAKMAGNGTGNDESKLDP